MKVCLTLPGLDFFQNLRAGKRGSRRPAVKKYAASQKIFVHFAWNFVHVLYWQYGISLDKKIDKCHFCHQLMTSSWKSCVDVFKWIQNRKKYQNTNWVCKIHRKQVAGNHSKKLMITLRYKKIFQKINYFDHCIKIYNIFIFTRITFVKKWWHQQ